MKLKHARQILSGELYAGGKDFLFVLRDFGDPLQKINISKTELQFMLRQLALKTVREKEKGK